MQEFETALKLGQQAEAQGKLDEAEKHFEQALQQKPGDPKAAMFLVSILVKSGRHQDALTQCNQILMRDPGHAPVLWARATVFRHQEKYEAALADIEEAIRLQTDMLVYHLERGQILALSGDHAQAEKQLSAVMKRASETKETALMVSACQTIISIYRLHGLDEKAAGLEAALVRLSQAGQAPRKKKGCGSAAALLALAPFLFHWLCR